MALCMAHAVLSKKAWLLERMIQAKWPVWGVPQCVHADNGSDFKSEALRRGCEDCGIRIEFRPPGRAHFSPLVAWEKAVQRGIRQCLPQDPRRFHIGFMPVEDRTCSEPACDSRTSATGPMPCRRSHASKTPSARIRMPCALLYGDSGIGKTMILEKFARAHRPIYDDKLGQEVRPVLLEQMPSGPDERRLYASLLAEIGAPFHSAERIDTLETWTHVLLLLRVRLVVID